MNVGSLTSHNFSAELIAPSTSKAKKIKKKWTAAENTQLTQYVQEFGKNWKKIAQHMVDKDPTQCNLHWIRELKPTLTNGRRYGKWSAEENEQLKKLVNQHKKNWVEIAKHIPGRTNNQCRAHYERLLRPDINHGLWTAEEDERLQEAVQRIGFGAWGQWSAIANELPNRLAFQCSNRWYTLNKKSNKHTRERT